MREASRNNTAHAWCSTGIRGARARRPEPHGLAQFHGDLFRNDNAWRTSTETDQRREKTNARVLVSGMSPAANITTCT